MKAISTEYNGVVFRSRLEARWAAWFDLVGWSWDYEPLDMDGWTPDFSLRGKCGIVYAEVKPVDPTVASGVPPEDYKKAIKHAITHDILLIPVCPWVADHPCYGASERCLHIGWCNHIGDDYFDYAVEQCAVGPVRFGYCHATGDYSDRITGEHRKSPSDTFYDSGMGLWKKAGDITRWGR